MPDARMITSINLVWTSIKQHYRWKMDLDDEPRKKTGPLTDVEKEDLSTISADELQERIERLQDEISRTKIEIKAKQSSRAAADAFFNS